MTRQYRATVNPLLRATSLAQRGPFAPVQRTVITPLRRADSDTDDKKDDRESAREDDKKPGSEEEKQAVDAAPDNSYGC